MESTLVNFIAVFTGITVILSFLFGLYIKRKHLFNLISDTKGIVKKKRLYIYGILVILSLLFGIYYAANDIYSSIKELNILIADESIENKEFSIQFTKSYVSMFFQTSVFFLFFFGLFVFSIFFFRDLKKKPQH